MEFLAAIFDLIMIQEKTNYPNGVINRKLFEAFVNEKDIFSVNDFGLTKRSLVDTARIFPHAR